MECYSYGAVGIDGMLFVSQTLLLVTVSRVQVALSQICKFNKGYLTEECYNQYVSLNLKENNM